MWVIVNDPERIPDTRMWVRGSITTVAPMYIRETNAGPAWIGSPDHASKFVSAGEAESYGKKNLAENGGSEAWRVGAI